MIFYGVEISKSQLSISFNILHHSENEMYFFFSFFFLNKIRPFNIHKYANEVICISELHLKEQS